jgi:putative DNA primase/helicase
MQSCPELSGIGFCFSKEDGLAGIDLDHCFDSGGALLDWASEILDQFHQSYIELSPSGDGLHIWCYGKAVRAGRRIVLSKERGVEEAIEIYDSTSNRYFTVTGKPFRRLQK